ncbi:paraquat-inducible protein A [Granulosicoccaceae sp. 1_MG-2023]|nr:paraquat-inducible protein A [Granulosicoccaceae sp. 1_MG-2023]
MSRITEAPQALGRARPWLPLLLLLGTVCLLVGLLTPMFTLSKFIWIRNSVSVVGGLQDLWQSGRYGLFLIIGLFSVLLPLLKVLVLFRLMLLSRRSRLQRWLAVLHDYGRWAMLDVMVVAVLIVTVKLGVLVSIDLHYGFYVFTLAVLIIMLVTHLTANYVAAD